MRTNLALLCALTLVGCTPGAAAAHPYGYTLEILVDGRPLPEFAARGTRYIEAFKGKECRHPSPQPVTRAGRGGALRRWREYDDARRTVAADARKWVLDPYETITIRGWQTATRMHDGSTSLPRNSLYRRSGSATPRTSASSAPCSSGNDCQSSRGPPGRSRCRRCRRLHAPTRPREGERGAAATATRRRPPASTDTGPRARSGRRRVCGHRHRTAGRSPVSGRTSIWKRRPRPQSRCAMNTVRSWSGWESCLPAILPTRCRDAKRRAASRPATAPSRRNGEGRGGHRAVDARQTPEMSLRGRHDVGENGARSVRPHAPSGPPGR